MTNDDIDIPVAYWVERVDGTRQLVWIAAEVKEPTKDDDPPVVLRGGMRAGMPISVFGVCPQEP